jgi:hypothetical protein
VAGDVSMGLTLGKAIESLADELSMLVGMEGLGIPFWRIICDWEGGEMCRDSGRFSRRSNGWRGVERGSMEGIY